MTNKHWIKNCWYQIAWAEELEDNPIIARTLLEKPLVLFRNGDGELACLLDRCPHRFAPLSKGKLEQNKIVCGYHGLSFDKSGACVHNPHGRTSAGLKVDSYPVAEKHCAVWVWLGDSDKADAALIPDLGFIDETPELARISGYMPTLANYQLIIDNILDLSHADYLHPSTIGGMMTDADVTLEEIGGHIVVSWDSRNAEVPMGFQQLIPPPNKGDFWLQVEWQAPGVLILRNTACIAGNEPADDAMNTTLHNMVPETDSSTHYFYCSTRKSHLEDAGFTEFLRGALTQAFANEDKPMLEAQQERIGNADFWSLKPRMLSIDAPAVKVRRALDKKVAEEKQS
jgi:vanillate O-demethylase monooxygenase subunit